MSELKDISSQMATITEAKFGRKHPETLLCLGKQASACTHLGELNEAESLYMEVVEARIELLGPEHDSTLTAKANLASVYWYQQRTQDALVLDEEVARGFEKSLGATHPSTLQAKENLAWTYGDRTDNGQ